MLPEKYKPKEVAPVETEAAVELKEPLVTGKEADDLMISLGFVKVRSDKMQNLAKLGVFMQQAGVMRMQRGRSFVLQEQLQETMELILARIRSVSASENPNSEELVALAEAQSDLADKITKSQQMLIELDATNPEAKKPEGVQRPTFAPGQQVRPVTNIVTKSVTINEAQ